MTSNRLKTLENMLNSKSQSVALRTSANGKKTIISNCSDINGENYQPCDDSKICNLATSRCNIRAPAGVKKATVNGNKIFGSEAAINAFINSVQERARQNNLGEPQINYENDLRAPTFDAPSPSTYSHLTKTQLVKYNLNTLREIAKNLGIRNLNQIGQLDLIDLILFNIKRDNKICKSKSPVTSCTYSREELDIMRVADLKKIIEKKLNLRVKPNSLKLDLINVILTATKRDDMVCNMRSPNARKCPTDDNSSPQNRNFTQSGQPIYTVESLRSFSRNQLMKIALENGFNKEDVQNYDEQGLIQVLTGSQRIDKLPSNANLAVRSPTQRAPTERAPQKENVDEDELYEMKLPELKKIATELQIIGRSSMRKDDLISAIISTNARDSKVCDKVKDQQAYSESELKEMKVAELKKIAVDYLIVGRSTMNKNDLIKSITAALKRKPVICRPDQVVPSASRVAPTVVAPTVVAPTQTTVETRTLNVPSPRRAPQDIPPPPSRPTMRPAMTQPPSPPSMETTMRQPSPVRQQPPPSRPTQVTMPLSRALSPASIFNEPRIVNEPLPTGRGPPLPTRHSVPTVRLPNDTENKDATNRLTRCLSLI